VRPVVDVAALQALDTDEKLELLELLELRDRRLRQNWLAGYKPYAKQRKFHESGRTYRERLFMAGNQLGKTYAGAAEVAYHATGLYPPGWTGHRFNRATTWLVGSESAELTRKGVQRLLLGPPQMREEWGTGAIPKSHLVDTSLKQGVPDAVASVVVRNEYGGNSVIQFNSYDQGRTKWQADTVDGVWFDEEPPLDIYTEGLTRTNASGGIVFVTFTPLLGMSKVVKRFLLDKPAGTTVISMTIDDAEHYTPEQRAATIARYPEHERDARIRGIPIMGSGLVFPVSESTISCDPFPIPPHWGRINAIDFGWDHPAGFVALAHDRDTDTAYVYDAWRLRNKSAAEQSMVIIGKGYKDIPWAWPHDGLQHDKGAGTVLVSQYRAFGVNMLPERAQFPETPEGRPGGNSLEAGVGMMLTRFQARTLRVFAPLVEWFEEFRLYHRKDGIIVPEGDDILSATRYGLMMLRKARNQYEMQVHRPSLLSANEMPSREVFDTISGY
jgi:phage terminase large subunit-like protein